MSRGGRLLSAYPQNAQNIMHRYFERSQVKLHLNAGAFNSEKEEVKQYDIVLKCIGSSQNSQYMQNETFKNCVDKSGRIKVNHHF